MRQATRNNDGAFHCASDEINKENGKADAGAHPERRLAQDGLLVSGLRYLTVINLKEVPAKSSDK